MPSISDAFVLLPFVDFKIFFIYDFSASEVTWARVEFSGKSESCALVFSESDALFIAIASQEKCMLILH